VNSPPVGGRASGHEGLLFYRFDDDGLVAEEHRYLDALTPMAQMGALGPTLARAVPTLPEHPNVRFTVGMRAERENTDFVVATIREMSTRDPLLSERFADDVVIDEVMCREAFRGVAPWLRMWRTAMPNARWEIVSADGVGDVVFVELIGRGTLAGPLGRVPASGSTVTIHRGTLFELRRGRIARVTSFMNGRELAESAGRWPLNPGNAAAGCDVP
jgi:steroid delta-isomerase-like uncharacterized protein